MFDQFFILVTNLGNYAAVWFGMALIVALQQKKRAQTILASTISAVTLSFLATTVLKLLFRLPRPNDIPPLTTYNCPVDFSFPSGHASTSFAAAFILVQFDPKRKWLYFILAALISYSRIYLGCHHVADVIVGAILGTLTSLIIKKVTSHQSKPIVKAKRTR